MRYSLEGNPFIIRFKTKRYQMAGYEPVSLEGNPFIIRFKTYKYFLQRSRVKMSLEGNPFIIRFKTQFKRNDV